MQPAFAGHRSVCLPVLCGLLSFWTAGCTPGAQNRHMEKEPANGAGSGEDFYHGTGQQTNPTTPDPISVSVDTVPVTSFTMPVTRLDVRLIVLHVQVPRSRRAESERLWPQLREDTLPSTDVLRLERNGLRIGVGKTELWDELRKILDDIPGIIAFEMPPLNALPGVPLGLELDPHPRDHTIFYMDRDGIISGDTWPASERVLRVVYTLDTQEIDRVLLSVVPEIRRHLKPALTYTPEAGWDAGPRREGRAFASAAFVLTLGPDEFVVVAPGPKADVLGLVGGAFLTEKRADDVLYDSFVFLRADVRHVQ